MKTAITPAHFPWFDYSRYTFSLGLDLGESVLLSGHSASEFDREARTIVVKGGLAEQTRTAYAKIAAILGEAGLQVTDATRIVENLHVRATEDYAEVRAVRDEILGDHGPAISTVIVNGLLRPAASIEIEVSASRRPVEVVASRAGHAVRTGDGLVHLSTILPIDEDGSVVAEGDLAGQTRFVYEQAVRVLDEAGLSPANVAKTLDHSTGASTSGDRRAAVAARAEVLGGWTPASSGFVVSHLHRSGLLTALDVVAAEGAIEVVAGAGLGDGVDGRPAAVIAGDVVLLSGQTAADASDDVVGQAERIYEAIARTLEAVGLRPADLLETIESVTPAGLDRYREVAKVRDRHLAAPYPASTGTIVEAHRVPGALIEVDSQAAQQ